MSLHLTGAWGHLIRATTRVMPTTDLVAMITELATATTDRDTMITGLRAMTIAPAQATALHRRTTPLPIAASRQGPKRRTLCRSLARHHPHTRHHRVRSPHRILSLLRTRRRRRMRLQHRMTSTPRQRAPGVRVTTNVPNSRRGHLPQSSTTSTRTNQLPGGVRDCPGG
jgi:hypothetical protein